MHRQQTVSGLCLQGHLGLGGFQRKIGQADPRRIQHKSALGRLYRQLGSFLEGERSQNGRDRCTPITQGINLEVQRLDPQMRGVETRRRRPGRNAIGQSVIQQFELLQGDVPWRGLRRGLIR